MPATAERATELAAYTTMRVGGPAADLVVASTPRDLVKAVREADEAGTPLFVLGGGSNVLTGDAGFAGRVVLTRGGGLSLEELDDERVLVRAQAGTTWDDLVEFAVCSGLAGIEALSGIPGQIGSAVMQNLGAYGQEAGSCLAWARLLDRETGTEAVYAADELGLGYRTSMLRVSLEESGSNGGRWYPTPRWVVLETAFELKRTTEGVISHPQLARALNCEVGERMDIVAVREAVLAVRAEKGMVADPDPCGPSPVYDRWSSGSFFTNPVVSAEFAEANLPAEAPRYATGNPGTVKTSAAWLIEHAGFPKGYAVREDAPATLSTLHTLALTNRGAACAADIAELARTVRDGVRERFGIELVPETVLVGVEL